ncbi:FliI/YscN family ATPase [Novosphingopyxis sp.]|uniref:FliI/YscN family ATPase n=1 Tax=Novosphingopyxis sp. TaxID=2709690 RepID=UPI003B5BFB6C
MNACSAMLSRIAATQFTAATGRVRRMRSNFIEADGPMSSVGDLCWITGRGGGEFAAEVAAVDEDRIVLMPFEPSPSVAMNASVRSGDFSASVGVGDRFAGRAVDALGRSIDDLDEIRADAWMPIEGRPLGTMRRTDPKTVLPTGVRAIDALLTLGVGQRIGIFAASGVGKTSLVEQLVRQVECDRLVVCLVGERGREVERFWRMLRQKKSVPSTLVAATSDESAAMRARSVRYAISLSEYWRDRGEHVALIVDSATRAAMALREIGLAAGEPPTVRGYTPNVFAAIPRLVERCGASVDGGAISAFFTVLTETDDADDPVAEMMRSLLDGHIVLSRRLAEMSHYPAIDVVRSISRNAAQLRGSSHAAAARKLVAALSVYEDSRAMIETGLYREGTNEELDEAVSLRRRALPFLMQEDRATGWDECLDQLIALTGGKPA